MVQEGGKFRSNFNYIKEVNEYFNIKSLDKSSLSIVSFIDILDRFLSWLGVKSFEDIKGIDASLCGNYIVYLCEEKKLRDSTVNKHIRALKAIFNWWFLKRSYLSKNPWDGVDPLTEEKGKEIKFMTPEEADQFVSAAKNIEEKFMFAFFIATGVRRNELINIKMKDISGNRVRIVYGKGKKQRSIFMSEEIQNLYEQYLVWRSKKPYRANSEYLFVSKAQKSYSGQAILDKMKSLMKRAGFPQERIDELYVHCLRKTLASNNFRNGVPVEVTQKILGHSSPLITQMIYTAVEEAMIEQAMRNQKPIIKVKE